MKQWMNQEISVRVELGKQLANKILPELSADSALAHDGSTNELIRRYRAMRRTD